MSSCTSNELWRQRQHYVNQKFSDEAKIREYERSYESLSGFKTVVTRSQDDFHSLNYGKAQFLTELDDVKQNSLIAQKYRKGMEQMISNFGSSVIAMVYTVLLGSISARMRRYIDSINSCDSDAAFCERKIQELDVRLQEVQQQEAAAMGGQM